MKYLLIFCAFFVAANAQLTVNGICQNVSVVQNFDLQQYSGLWYEIFRYEHINQFFGDCVQANYATDNGTLLIENSMVLNGNYLQINGYGVPSLNAADGEAKFNITFPSADNQFSQYWVLATDYYSYALVYACTNLQNNNKRVSSWILSKTRSLSPQAVLALDPFIQASIGLFWNNYRETSQSESSCRYNTTTTSTTLDYTTDYNTTTTSTSVEELYKHVFN